MKIERLSENQIRCTLNKDDLIDRELKLSELAYGTEKAKNLFRDMMTQASFELGFEADDIPLVIEAIPVSGDCIILIVTKVDDPDELDTRFAKFSSSPDASDLDDDDGSDSYDDYKGADEILDLFKKLSEDIMDHDDDEEQLIPVSDKAKKALKKARSESSESTGSVNISKVFIFDSLNDVITLASALSSAYLGVNTLYKDPKSLKYYLVLWKSCHTPKEFNKICNIVSEYGRQAKHTNASPAYYNEHFEIIVDRTAIQILGTL